MDVRSGPRFYCRFQAPRFVKLKYASHAIAATIQLASEPEGAIEAEAERLREAFNRRSTRTEPAARISTRAVPAHLPEVTRARRPVGLAEDACGPPKGPSRHPRPGHPYSSQGAITCTAASGALPICRVKAEGLILSADAKHAASHAHGEADTLKSVARQHASLEERLAALLEETRLLSDRAARACAGGRELSLPARLPPARPRRNAIYACTCAAMRHARCTRSAALALCCSHSQEGRVYGHGKSETLSASTIGWAGALRPCLPHLHSRTPASSLMADLASFVQACK
jgi:hypothetical protein